MRGRAIKFPVVAIGPKEYKFNQGESMNRRQFTGHLVAGSLGVALGGATISMSGCSAISDLESWVPVGLAAFDGVAAVVDSIFTNVATTVDDLWAAVNSAIANYQHSTDPVTTRLDKLIAALDALASGLTQALSALPVSIPAGVLTAAKAILALTIATLKSIQARLEPTPTPVPAKVKLAIGGAAPAKSKRDYVKQVNAICAANGLALRVQ
jgi:hypothetical protein